jgi:hypothetical protein
MVAQGASPGLSCKLKHLAPAAATHYVAAAGALSLCCVLYPGTDALGYIISPLAGPKSSSSYLELTLISEMAMPIPGQLKGHCSTLSQVRLASAPG